MHHQSKSKSNGYYQKRKRSNFTFQLTFQYKLAHTSALKVLIGLEHKVFFKTYVAISPSLFLVRLCLSMRVALGLQGVSATLELISFIANFISLMCDDSKKQLFAKRRKWVKDIAPTSTYRSNYHRIHFVLCYIKPLTQCNAIPPSKQNPK